MKSIVIVGVGALGSHVVQFLRNVDASIKVIDFDRIEQKNVLSQFHGRPSVGKNKATSLAQQMAFLFGKKIEAVPHKLIEDNVETLLKDADLVIDCLDNGASRRLVQGFVRKVGKPCLHGALAADGAFGRIVWDENFVIDDEGVGGGATCEDGAHLAFIGIVSACVARAVQEHMSGRKIGFIVSPSGVMRT